ncbi:bifunctional folylpolyglutamate synthase/dihydrofolate synthase [Tenuibacillus multivorans]|uniref:Dihydrofolate synthase/folylpolyglutamate synthase n=1 Tax=Tenuibacillus multivorans TaxID=237069 RepID=A0A1G9ZLG2_9BACI|nr:folylpolyglutamate synthase/dihydrofolate synthase family protein [Tenuibacillus multivorans]GEL77448.1 bifunctional folylpolyglutamate synthase/dihydrofolate synthase [Tenuibacillus multivorans]SDN22188.1 dihydrofolate synthase / folylpolyglutamate synthase [Tenuibacillus multivorans]
MNESQAIDWIHKQLKFGIKPGLKRVQWLLSELDNPDKHLKIVHVAGTNGKGSTVAFLRHILQEHGFSVGTFTSPYIEVFNERISINGEPISGEDLVQYVTMIKPLCEQLAKTDLGSPTEFEIITVIALKYFQEIDVEYAIFEVGLGGRLDSTNVIDPVLSVITTIGFDHTDILGETIEEIAYEKAGIIKQKKPVMTNVVDYKALNIIEKQAKKMNSPLSQLTVDFNYQWLKSLYNGEIFSFRSKCLTIDRITLNMSGQHQVENATLAIFTFKKLSDLEGFSISIEKIKEGIRKTTWIGRYEIVQENPTIILDGAHNIEALKPLLKTLGQRYRHEKVDVLFSAVKGKPVDQMLQLLQRHFETIHLTAFDFFKSYRHEELLQKFRKYGIIVSKNWKNVVDEFNCSQDSDSVLVITGSLYFVSEVRSYLTQQK